eukprot:1795428-Ditylum_brightwellii.AAC.1
MDQPFTLANNCNTLLLRQHRSSKAHKIIISFREPKSTNSQSAISSSNINGLSIANDWTELKGILFQMGYIEVDIFAFAETNAPWTPEMVYQVQNYG